MPGTRPSPRSAPNAAWLAHVARYRRSVGCSYKNALIGASPSYRAANVKPQTRTLKEVVEDVEALIRSELKGEPNITIDRSKVEGFVKQVALSDITRLSFEKRDNILASTIKIHILNGSLPTSLAELVK